MMSSERSDDESPQREGTDRAPAPAAAGHLALLDALLDVAGDTPDFARLFAAARSVFAFDDGAVLLDEADALRCAATDPDEAEPRRWPASPALAQAVRSRIIILAAGAPSAERALLPDGAASPDQPVMLIPIGVGGRHAILLLRRAAGAPEFAPD